MGIPNLVGGSAGVVVLCWVLSIYLWFQDGGFRVCHVDFRVVRQLEVVAGDVFLARWDEVRVNMSVNLLGKAD